MIQVGIIKQENTGNDKGVIFQKNIRISFSRIKKFLTTNFKSEYSQQYQIESLEIYLNMHKQLFYSLGTKIILWRKTVFTTIDTGTS